MGVILLLIFDSKKSDEVHKYQVKRLEAEISDLQSDNLRLYAIISQDSIKLSNALKKTDSVTVALELKDKKLKQIQKGYEKDIDEYFDYDFNSRFQQLTDNLSN